MFRRVELHEGRAFLMTEEGDLYRLEARYGAPPLMMLVARGVHHEDDQRVIRECHYKAIAGL